MDGGERGEDAWDMLVFLIRFDGVRLMSLRAGSICVVGGDGDAAYTCTGGRNKDSASDCFNVRIMWRFVPSHFFPRTPL